MFTVPQRNYQKEIEAGVSTLESILLAAQKEIEAAKPSENLAIAVIKALQEKRVQINNKITKIVFISFNLNHSFTKFG